jgi:hypothetical protein
MILQRLIKTDIVPPNGYRFIVPETGCKIGDFHRMVDLLPAIEAHYQSNNIDLPPNWKEKVEDQMCRSLPAGWCSLSDGKDAVDLSSIMSADNIIKAIKSLAAMASTALKGEEVFVGQDEANIRASICARCYMNVDAGFCMGCGSMQQVTELVGKVRGSRTTDSDQFLSNCGICGCQNKAIVHVKRKLLLSGEKQETTDKRPDWCWLKSDDLNTSKSLLKI